MRRFICVLVVLATPALRATGGDNDARTELKALEGKWKAVALEAGGKSLPKEAVPDFTFTVGAGGKSIGKMPKGDYEASIRVDPTKDPKTIDNVYETGVHKGKTQFGIYKLEGGKWIVCMTPPGAAETDRPKGFDTKDSTNVIFVFERIQENKKP
jgi:uncharacterized protein (TIGR03067 family)